MSVEMKVNGLTCVLHAPKRSKQRIVNGVEQALGLPPYCPREAYVVDEYPACPTNWMNGSDKASSYFVAVDEDKGMWLNFNDCSKYPYHVAAVISIQGINPITGKKTDSLRLEQYKHKCPVHDVEFKQDRFCPECKYKWPAQNYIASTGTPFGQLWLDGFRNPDGTVRQYVFTAEEIKGVAKQLIGDDRVYAIGIAFYRSKNKKPEMPVTGMFRSVEIKHEWKPAIIGTIQWDKYTNKKPIEYGPSTINYDKTLYKGVTSADYTSFDSALYDSMEISLSCDTTKSVRGIKSMRVPEFSLPQSQIMTKKSMSDYLEESNEVEDCIRGGFVEVEPVTKLEIGAGALIKQQIYEDPEMLDYWEETPVGMVYINYCDKQTAKMIIAAGKREEKKEGYLQGIETL